MFIAVNDATEACDGITVALSYMVVDRIRVGRHARPSGLSATSRLKGERDELRLPEETCIE